MRLTQSTWEIVVQSAFYDAMLFSAYPIHGPSCSERSESLCCWHASLLLSLSYCRLSLLKHLLYLWRGTCRRVHKLYVNSYTSVINPLQTYIHTYKHNLRLRPHKHPPCLHDYVPHAKVFGNYCSKNAIIKEALSMQELLCSLAFKLSATCPLP